MLYWWGLLHIRSCFLHYSRMLGFLLNHQNVKLYFTIKYNNTYKVSQINLLKTYCCSIKQLLVLEEVTCWLHLCEHTYQSLLRTITSLEYLSNIQIFLRLYLHIIVSQIINSTASSCLNPCVLSFKFWVSF